MTTVTFAAPAVAFAQLTGGTLRWGNSGEECAYADGSFVYWNFLGQVRFQQHQRVVTVLGAWSDAPEDLAKAYRVAVAGA